VFREDESGGECGFCEQRHRNTVLGDHARRWAFAFELVPPGDYLGRAESTGVPPQITPHLHVDVGGAAELEFKLLIVGAKESATVSGEPQLVERSPGRFRQSLMSVRSVIFPSTGAATPIWRFSLRGVTQDPRGLTSGSNGDLAFGGIRGYQSSHLVDGGDNNNGFSAQARGRYRAPSQFSNEVVQEFRVSCSTYGAEVGRAGGAVVIVVTKSGSNQIHGSSFYFLRDSALAAQHPFMDFKPRVQQQQFGLTLGGRIRWNRAFFFAGLRSTSFTSRPWCVLWMAAPSYSRSRPQVQ